LPTCHRCRLSEKGRQKMYFDDCQNPKDLYDAIEGNPTYKLMSKDISFRPQDFRFYRGTVKIPYLGIDEYINMGKLRDPKQIYRDAKRCVLRLCKKNPKLKPPNFSNEEDSLTGLQNIMAWCIEAGLASKQPKESEQPTETSSVKAEEPPQQTPETDTKFIYQTDAATFYNIPKSTLSKAANKKPGEPGYLWSSHKGKRVFLRKSDCQRLAQSRTKLRNV